MGSSWKSRKKRIRILAKGSRALEHGNGDGKTGKNESRIFSAIYFRIFTAILIQNIPKILSINGRLGHSLRSHAVGRSFVHWHSWPPFTNCFVLDLKNS